MPATDSGGREQKVNRSQSRSITPPIDRFDAKARSPDLSIIATLRMGDELQVLDEFRDAFQK
jgi:hypothetical protein